MNRPFLGGVFLVGGSVMQAAMAFAANLVLVRFLAPEDFGSYALTLALISLIFSLGSLRLVTLVIREPDAAMDSDARRRYTGAMAVEVGLMVVVTAGVLAVLDQVTAFSLMLLAAVAAGHALGNLKAFYERGMPYARLGTVETMAALCAHATVTILVFTGAGAAALYIRDCISVVAIAIGLWSIGALNVSRPRLPRKAEWMALLANARGLWIDGILEGVFQRLTVLAAGLLGGTRDAGFFFQAQRLSLIPHLVVTPLVSRFAVTWMSRTDEAARRVLRDRLLAALAIPLFLFTAAILIWADPVVPWLFGELWKPVSPILAWLVGAMLFTSLYEVVKSYCQVTGRVGVLFGSRVVQYAVFGIFVIPAAAGGAGGVIDLSLAVSAATAAAFALGWCALHYTER
jgi:O-antigen/teichoic acid export membrane protein